MENKKYKRRKSFCKRTWQENMLGRGKGGRVEKDWNQWLLTFYVEVLCDGWVHYWNAQWSIIPYIKIVYLANYLVIWSLPLGSEAALSRNEEVVGEKKGWGTRKFIVCDIVGCVFRKANVKSKMIYLLFLLNRGGYIHWPAWRWTVSPLSFLIFLLVWIDNFKWTVFEFTKSFFGALVCCWTSILIFFFIVIIVWYFLM